ncbi:Transthyretin-like family protein [Oesophagostomum dentatum]|uniref:Transthyretin-like family protein n=1 Tax=Oesophagostomum dentatum TaxID=61180 RepID=A0A0B1RUQ0_OESDE|nr:Transthyretin-like family protein [Oesophagostomum dentatum]
MLRTLNNSFQMKVLLFLSIFGLAFAMRQQSIAVKGTLKCGDKPATNVRVKLWEEDGGPDPDDELDAGYTDGSGMFQLSGGTAELTPIDPVFKVYHDCDDGIKPGSRKVKFYLPKSYITEGAKPRKTFDIGVLNLETIFPGEEREMIVSRKRRDDYGFLFDDNYDD